MGQKIWITSDTHFNHANIINYCARPFKDVEEMNATLISKWNNVVGKNDIVWHLGDFALGGAEEVSRFREKLNGKIYLIRGNHDHHTNGWYVARGFDKVYDRPVVIDKNVLLSHAPITTEYNCGELINLFGHVHNNIEWSVSLGGACVCVEHWNYIPVLLSDVKKMVEKERRNCDCKEGRVS